MGKELDRGDVYEGSLDALKDSSWLTSADLPWDRDTRVQIKEIRRHKNLAMAHETKSVAGSLVFVGKNKPLLMNAGHRATLKMLFGDAKGCQGKWILLYVDPNVRFGPNIVPGVRIQPKRVDGPAPKQATTPAFDRAGTIHALEEESVAGEVARARTALNLSAPLASLSDAQLDSLATAVWPNN